MECKLCSIVVGLAGPIGSGKTSIALRLADAIGCPVASFGTYVRNIATQIGHPESREILQEISEQLIVSLGPRGLTRNVLAASFWNREQSLIVDGIRHPAVVEALRSEAAPIPVLLVYLDVPPQVRYQRLAARDNLSASEVDHFESHSTERDVGTRVRALADLILMANDQVEDTVEAVINAIYS